jgi:2-methylcitrate dehydratase
MSAIASRSFARAAARSTIVRAPLRSSNRLVAQQAAKSSFSSNLSFSRHNTARAFSTTMVQASAGDAFASPAPAAEYDQEIVDMASYIHNYKIDSDLAVSCH